MVRSNILVPSFSQIMTQIFWKAIKSHVTYSKVKYLENILYICIVIYTFIYNWKELKFIFIYYFIFVTLLHDGKCSMIAK